MDTLCPRSRFQERLREDKVLHISGALQLGRRSPKGKHIDDRSLRF